MNIGPVIRNMRKEQGLTQSQLAKKVGINQVTLSCIERGKAMPEKQNLKALARALKVRVAMIYMFAIEPQDIPKQNRDYFKEVWPDMKEIIQNRFFKTV